MKKLLLFAVPVLVALMGYSQSYNPDFLDGTIMFKLKKIPSASSQGERVNHNLVSKEENLADFPQIAQVLEGVSVTKFERPSYYSNHRELMKICRVTFSNYHRIDELIKRLVALESIEYAEKEPIYKTNYVPNDFYHSGNNKWYHTLVGSEQAWDISLGSSSVKVAIVDNAVFADHDDLVTYKQYDVGDNDNDATPPQDYNTDAGWSHGTHCAGLATATINNSIGIASLGANAELIGVKATPNSGNSLSIYYGYNGVQWALANGANVVSMSYGGTNYSASMQTLINAYPSVVFLAAAGNDNSTTLQYPGAYDNVICVGSVDANDSRSGFSNYNGSTAFVDIASPGGYSYGGLYSSVYTSSGNSYARMGGTSMATPFAAGLVGLMLSINPSMSPSAIESCLISTGATINANIGPRIDAPAALACVQASLTGDPLPQFTGSPTSIYEGQTVTFLDQSADGGNAITSWQWTFTGGTPASFTGQNPPAITYSTSGIYDVSLAVTNNQSTQTEVKTGYINVSLAPYGEWLIQNSAFPAASTGINYVSIVDADIVWALGYDGSGGGANLQQFTKTTDGGTTWSAAPINVGNTGLGISMIDALDDNTAWLVAYPNAGGQTGGIWKTTNGGANWTRQNSASFNNANSFSNVVYFWDANVGFCQGDPINGEYELYTTTNGGANWNAVPGGDIPNPLSGEYGYVRDIEVVGDVVWYGTNTGRLYHSTDKGFTWAVYQTPLTDMQNGSYSFSTTTNGVLIDDAGLVYKTTDAGATWNQITTTGSVFTGGVCYIEGTNIIFSVSAASGVSGSSYSQDDGVTWNIIDTEQHLYTDFINPSIGWSGFFNQSSTTHGIWKWNNLNSAMNAAFSGTPSEVCAGATVNFTDNTTGSTPTSWLWSFPGGTPSTSTDQNPSVVYNTVGTYSVSLTVNDGSGPTMVTDTAYVNVVSAALMPSTITGTATPCVAATETYSVTNTAGLFYTWTLPNGWFGTSNTNSITTTVGSTSGNISVTADNACGSSAAQTLAITVGNPTVTANASSTNVCAGDQVTLTGAGAVSYSWNNGITDGVPFIANSTTSYIVSGTDVGGCTGTDTILITVDPIPSVSAGADQTVCEGTIVTLAGSGASSYSWDNGITDNVPFSASSTTTYAVLGTDVNGCIGTDTITVTVNMLPTVSGGAAQNVCDGDMVTLTGSGALTYSWDNGVTNGVPFNAPSVGTSVYNLVGTDANSCANIASVSVTVNAIPTITSESVVDATGCGTSDGTITITATGGTGTYSYSIDGGSTFQANGGVFTNLAVNSYQVVVTDGNCEISGSLLEVSGAGAPPAPNGSASVTYCDGDTLNDLTASGTTGTLNWYSDAGLTNNIGSGTSLIPANTIGSAIYYVAETIGGCEGPAAQISVTINSLPIVDAGNNQIVCSGTQVTLAGSGASTYTWDNGVLDGVAFNATQLGSTSYNVTGMDVNGCINFDAVDITVNASPAVLAGTDQTVCQGDTLTLSGSGAISYTWNNGVTNGIPFTASVLGATSYIVTGIASNSCVGSDTMIVTVNATPVVYAGPSFSVCEGTSVTLLASGATTYSWNNGVVNGVAFNVTGTGPISYIVTGTTAGCSAVDSLQITSNGLPTVAAGPDLSICHGDTVILTATGALSYLWDNGVVNNMPFVPASTNSYTVIGTDGNNCTNSDVVQVTVDQLDLTLSNSGGTVMANGIASSYQWVDCDNGNTPVTGATNQSFTPLINGNYAVMMTQGSCFGISECVYVVVSGIESQVLNSIRIYPNPIRNELYINGTPGTFGVDYKIIDVLGKLMHSGQLSSATHKIKSGNWDAGIYFIVIDDGKKVFKVIKQG